MYFELLILSQIDQGRHDGDGDVYDHASNGFPVDADTAGALVYYRGESLEWVVEGEVGDILFLPSARRQTGREEFVLRR